MSFFPAAHQKTGSPTGLEDDSINKLSFASCLDLDSEDLGSFPKFCKVHVGRNFLLEVALLDQADGDVGSNCRRSENLPKLFR